MKNYVGERLQSLLIYSTHKNFSKTGELSFGFPSNRFPAVAIKKCDLGRDPSKAELVHTLSGCSGTAREKPNPHVMSLVSDFRGGGGCGPLPFSTSANHRQICEVPACRQMSEVKACDVAYVIMAYLLMRQRDLM